ncbi:hypothetical protein EVAR_22648_1 [Eumeta japonica]|uniref:Uncharacterized protein n=1 Tax=Eumeta variegata TaxID=151549 RepID=A0A4C1VKW3_EUMVA|nr:hypothetical protein EVAR_22648_1 [Eumeta japonica]
MRGLSFTGLKEAVTAFDRHVLNKLLVQKTDVHVSHEATTLAEQPKDFSCLVSLVVWFDLQLGGALEISPRALVVLKSERIITRKAAKLT